MTDPKDKTPILETPEDPPVPKGAWVKCCNMKLSERGKAEALLRKAFVPWKASDIHIEWDEEGACVALRWDWPARNREIVFSYKEPL